MDEFEKFKVLVVGLGHQTIDDHIPAVLESDKLELTAVYDVDSGSVDEVTQRFGVAGTNDLANYLENNSEKIDVAIVAVPHQSYLNIIRVLASHKIDIIKEKPFATSYSEAVTLSHIIKEANINLYLTLQRRHNPVFTSFSQLINRIGSIHSIEARYVMNIKRLDEGWRASRLFAGGGALIDLGYHYIDLIVWYFGLPETVSCQISTGNREGQEYDVEDTAFVQFDYNPNTSHTNHILGNLVVSRVYPQKEERMIAFGTKGFVEVQRGTVSRTDENGDKQEQLERKGAWPSALVDQLEACVQGIKSGEMRGKIDSDYLKHVAFVAAAYESARLSEPVKPHEILNRMLNDLNEPIA